VSRLSTRIGEYAESYKKALVAYIVAGDPGKDITVKLMHAMVDAGVDVIELGVPFSDPEAEGPTIQLAHERALKQGTSLRDTLDMVCEFRQTDNMTPIILMGYLNPIEQMGYDIFARDASAAGVDGTIIVNLPPEEADNLSEPFRQHDIDTVYLLAPTTTDKRAAYVTANSRGFVYYVSLKGTTGSSTLDIGDVKEKLERFQKISSLPIMVGFGIKDAQTARQVAEISAGVVVGSAIVQLMGEFQERPDEGIEQIASLMSSMRQQIDKIPQRAS